MQAAAGSPQLCCQRRQLWILREADWDTNPCVSFEEHRSEGIQISQTDYERVVKFTKKTKRS